jgi:hypothetical protein
VEALAGRIADVDAQGLSDLLERFTSRRFLRHYTDPGALLDVIRHTLSLTSVRQRPGDRLLRELLEHAAELADPSTIWAALRRRPPIDLIGTRSP